MLLGGLVLATADRLTRISVPATWHAAVVHPHAVLETRRAREALQGAYALHQFVMQSANLAQVLLGCERGDAGLVRAGLSDVLVEPRRAPLIGGFAAVKHAALEAGGQGQQYFRCWPQRICMVCETKATAERCRHCHVGGLCQRRFRQ